MRISGGITERGIVVGNLYDKYNSSNFVVRVLVKNFETALWELVDSVQPRFVHEVGCGEGYFTLRFLERGIPAQGSDFSENVIALARANAVECGFSPDVFQVRDIYALDPDRDKAELIVCLEVLEHLEEPERAMRCLWSVSRPYCILSVPREPVWSALNVLRGKYLRRLGNTPGHVQRWSKCSFLRFVEQFFVVKKVLTPIPWIMVLCSR